MFEDKFRKITRRRALAASLRTAGVVAVGGTALAGDIARTAHAAGDETIKVALIGCGGRGAGAATQALSTRGPVTLWAMADVFEDKLETSLAALTKGQESRYDRKEHHGFRDKIDVPPERRFIGFDAYKKAIDSGVDMVILATSPHFRPMHYEYAVKQGKHVFMEKPVATDAPGVRQLLAANEEAKKKGLKVGVGLMYRHNLQYQEMIKRIQDGAIGDIFYIRCYANIGFMWTIPRRPEMSEMEYQMRNWQYFTWLGGDQIVEQHIHLLDVCNWAKGEQPVSAAGMGGRQVRKGPEHGQVYDHHVVEFTYSDGIKMFSQCRQISGCWSYVSEEVLGTKGSAYLRRGAIEGVDGRWRFRGKLPNPYQVEHDVLFDAIRNDKPHNEAEYAALSTMTAIMGRMATYSGKMINWDDAINSSVSLAPQRYAWDADPPILPGEDGLYPAAMPGVRQF